MPRKSTKGSLSSRVSSSVAKHKSDDTNYGVIDLPGGIKNGIAQLTDCRFDKYKSGRYQGEYFWLAAGTVIEPEALNGTPVRGLRTQIMEPICDTTKTNGDVVSLDDHVAVVLNELRKLGVDTEDMGDDDLEEVVESLKEVAPYFRFSTTQSEPTDQYPNPRVWENWHGSKGLEDYSPDDNGGVQDDTEDEEEPEPKSKPAPKSRPKRGPKAKKEDKQDLGNWVLDLGVSADEGDEESQVKLEELADEHGVDPEAYEDWSSVAQAIGPRLMEKDVSTREAIIHELSLFSEEGEGEEEGTEENDEEEQEEIVPEKEEVYFFKPPRARKGVEVEVTAVFKTKKTCNLKDLENNKSYKGVAWSDLAYVE